MLRLMSFNIRYGTADDGENHWNNRKDLVIERIRAFDPDLLGMQECRDDLQAKYIKYSLQEYGFYGVRREGGSDTALEMAPIFFKRSAFQLTQQGHFWLSETPEVPGSKSWGGTFPRTATWVQLVHRESDREFIFLNTHFDYEPPAIDRSAQLLKGWITQATEKFPVIVTGDFNADKNSSAYRQLTEQASLLDVYRQVHLSGNNEETFHGFGQTDDLSPIDWILASDSFEVVAAEIDRYHAESVYPSDHYPVRAELEWK